MLIQHHAPTLRPLTTAHLAQTMTLLELTTAELRQRIEAALANNPALELIDEKRCPTCGRTLPGNILCPACRFGQSLEPDQPIVFLSQRDDFFQPQSSSTSENDLPDDNFVTSQESLAEYVFNQISPELAPEDRPIAVHVLTSLNEDGLLEISLAEIAHYHHVPRSRVESVVSLIQRSDPLGVGSPSPQDALLVQLEALSEIRDAPPLAADAIRAGIDLLSPHRTMELARALSISSAQAREIVRFISDNLNPFPARAHWGEANQSASQNSQASGTYSQPDIIISCLHAGEDSPLVIEVAMPIHGTLRVNPLFRDALQQAPPDKAELWQADLDQATLLVKCLQQRNHTIIRLMKRLATIQRGFILRGDAALLPLTRAEMAEELCVHESTISRAVSDKTVQLPSNRIIPMAIFFDRSLHIRTALKEIIEQETSTLSDSQIAKILSKQGFPVARRTVAKYRAMEGILPAHLRAHLHTNQTSHPTQ